MHKKLPYLFLALLAVAVRLYLNFHTQLIPGLNGAYYPLQVRALLSQGALAFPDMPLLFYVQALFVKLFGLIVPGIESAKHILFVSKLIDSIFLPLMAIPAYMLLRDFFNNRVNPLYQNVMIAFLLLSFSPLMLTSDLQKNAFAMPLMLFFIYYLLRFFRSQSRKSLVVAILFLLFTGITHFGVFSVCFIFFILGFIIFYRKKAFLPVAITVVSSVALVALFDLSRAERLLVFWWMDKDFSISSRFFMDPPAIVNYLFSLFIAIITIRVLWKHRNNKNQFAFKALLLLLGLLLMMLYPFLRFEFWRRLGMMQFLPQVLLLLMLYPYLGKKLRGIFTAIAVILVFGSLFIHITRPKPASITEAAYTDLQKIGSVVEKDKNMIIVTRHGLDWWVAWALETKIALAYHNELDETFRKQYDPVYIIKQKKGRNRDYPGKQSPFTEPKIPEGSIKVYHSDYFELYQLID